MKKLNSLIHLRPALRDYAGLSVACSTVVKTPASAEAMADKMADLKPDRLNAFKIQGSVSREGAKIRKDLNPQNREHFVQKRNENHETNHSHKRVCEDGFSHGSPLKTPFEGSPVLNAFRRSADLFAVVPQCGTKEKALAKVDQSVKYVVQKPAFSLRSAAVKNVFSAISPSVHQPIRRLAPPSPAFHQSAFIRVNPWLKMVLNWRLIPAFRRSDRSAWTKANSPSSQSSYPKSAIVLRRRRKPISPLAFLFPHNSANPNSNRSPLWSI